MVFDGRYLDQALLAARRFADETGAVLIHPFDHDDIVAGQGTCGLEILEQMPEVRTVLVPTGGGGLIAGIAIAIKALRPDVRVVGVQAAGAAALPESLTRGVPTPLESMTTMADGIAVGCPGVVPFAAVQATTSTTWSPSPRSRSPGRCWRSSSAPRWWSSRPERPPWPPCSTPPRRTPRPWWRCSPAATSTRCCSAR